MKMRRVTKEKKSSAAHGLPRLAHSDRAANEAQQMNMRRVTKETK